MWRSTLRWVSTLLVAGCLGWLSGCDAEEIVGSSLDLASAIIEAAD